LAGAGGPGLGGFGGAGGGVQANGLAAAPDPHRAQLTTRMRAVMPTAEYAESLRRATDRAAAYGRGREAAPDGALERALSLGRTAKVAGAKREPEAITLREARAAEPVPPLVVREFAAPRPAAAPLADEEAPDTVLWRPVIVLPSDGKATLHFHLGAAPGGYEVAVAGHTADGRLGAARGLVRVSPAPTVNPAGPVAPPAPAATNPPPAP
jgi:hypothetical protein